MNSYAVTYTVPGTRDVSQIRSVADDATVHVMLQMSHDVNDEEAITFVFVGERSDLIDLLTEVQFEDSDEAAEYVDQQIAVYRS